jgi:hypothetical protein
MNRLTGPSSGSSTANNTAATNAVGAQSRLCSSCAHDHTPASGGHTSAAAEWSHRTARGNPRL